MKALVQTGEAGHICRKLSFGESETQMLSMDDLFKGRHFEREIIILCVRWYLRFKLSFRDLVEMMAERGIDLAHTTIMRWIQRYVPEFEKRWNRLACKASGSWRVCREGFLPAGVREPAQLALRHYARWLSGFA